MFGCCGRLCPSGSSPGSVHGNGVKKKGDGDDRSIVVAEATLLPHSSSRISIIGSSYPMMRQATLTEQASEEELEEDLRQQQQAVASSSSRAESCPAFITDGGGGGEEEAVVVAIADPSPDTNFSTMSTAQDLSFLIQRLEVIANRLESASGGAGAASEIRKELASLRSNPSAAIETLRETVDALEQAVGGGGISQETLSASVGSFDDILSGSFTSFLGLCSKIGGEVSTQGQWVDQAFKLQRQFLVAASQSRQPGQNDLPLLLKPTSDKIAEIQSIREANRRSPLFNHMSAISESISALGWVAVTPAPAPYIKEMNDAGQFYTNRVLKEFKEKDKTHAEWVKAWINTLNELQAYVKQYHTTGLVWNPKGGDAVAALRQGGGGGKGAPSSGGGPPLPPPPPPPGFFDDVKVQDNPHAPARNKLFDDLNKGENVTQGLKKVTSDMQTHKNPELRSGSTVPAGAAKSGGGGGSKYVAPAANKPPKFELDGKKWVVEYFKANPNIEIEKTETNQSVYVYKCEGSTIKVGGKCNNIIMDSCKKSAIVFDSVVSSIEFINCQSVQMQVLGKVPTISIEKTDGCQMFLSKDSLSTSLITAKSSEMNVMIPSGDDFVEQPVPEQFKTTISGTKLNTTVTEST